MTYDTIFSAIGDPTRRSVLEALKGRPMTVGMLAEKIPVSRPAVSQHLKILKAARLVTVRPKGAANEYSIDQRGLDEVRQWLDGMWDDALAAFKAHMDQNSNTKPGDGNEQD